MSSELLQIPHQRESCDGPHKENIVSFFCADCCAFIGSSQEFHSHGSFKDDLYWNLLQFYTFKRRGISGRGIPNYPLGELYYLSTLNQERTQV